MEGAILEKKEERREERKKGRKKAGKKERKKWCSSRILESVF